MAYKHNGFWQCMDTLRDKEILENLIKKNNYFE
jgi:glucose-1-phosphate cytidylyltransferase